MYISEANVGCSGGLPYKKDSGACRKFSKEPLRGTKILFCGRGSKFFPSLRGTCTNSKTVHNLDPGIIFGLNSVNDTTKAPTGDLLRLNTLGGNKTAF